MKLQNSSKLHIARSLIGTIIIFFFFFSLQKSVVSGQISNNDWISRVTFCLHSMVCLCSAFLAGMDYQQKPMSEHI